MASKWKATSLWSDKAQHSEGKTKLCGGLNGPSEEFATWTCAHEHPIIPVYGSPSPSVTSGAVQTLLSLFPILRMQCLWAGTALGSFSYFFFPIFVLSLFEKHRGNDAVWHPLLLEHCPGTRLVISTPLSPSVAFEYQNSFAIGRIFTHFDSSYHVELSNWVKEPRALEAHRAWVCMAPVRHSQHLCT